MFIPGSELFPSRIRIKEFKYFNPKNCLPIPDPEVKKASCHQTFKKAPDPGSVYVTLIVNSPIRKIVDILQKKGDSLDSSVRPGTGKKGVGEISAFRRCGYIV
jgi:hypothetical protein